MNKVIIILWLSTLLISWCSLQPKSINNNSNNIGWNEAYTHWVNHTVSWETHEITLNPHEQKIQFFDNWWLTSLWSYSQSDEPIIIRAKQWDILNVTVVNGVPQETSVHWHGIRVPNDQDWVPGVTQEPIPVWGTYTYNIPLQDAGTFLFHPHINTVEQMGRGLYGLLIVEPETYPFEFDEEIVWALKDYRLNSDWTLNENFEWMMDFTHAWRLWNALTINNKISPTYELPSWSTALIRFINPSNARIYNLDLSSRNAKVVWTDWWLISQPYDAWLIQLSPWERMEILVSIGSKELQLIDNYFPKNPYQLATISPTWLTEKKTIEMDIHWFPSIPDRSALSSDIPNEVISLWWVGVMWWDRWMMAWWSRWWTINDGIWPHTNEVLHRKIWEMRTVRLQNKSKRDHPMHLHGDFFQVLWVNWSEVPWHGWKDTINVPALWYTDLAIIPTNPWTWMFHCHIIEHAHYGMMTTVVVE